MARVYLADKDTLDSVNNKVGTASDAASATPGSLFAGIKQLISVLSNHVAVWTSARASKIDNLDATMSSRAPANTALNKNTWTDARAGYLDRLANGVSVGSLDGKLIKSIQRGIITIPQGSTTASVAINTVNTNKAFILHCGAAGYGYLYNSASPLLAYLTLNSATSVEAVRADGQYQSLRVSWQVIEFF